MCRFMIGRDADSVIFDYELATEGEYVCIYCSIRLLLLVKSIEFVGLEWNTVGVFINSVLLS